MKNYASEYVGTTLLLAIVAGSGLMGETWARETLQLPCWAIVLQLVLVFMY